MVNLLWDFRQIETRKRTGCRVKIKSEFHDVRSPTSDAWLVGGD